MVIVSYHRYRVYLQSLSLDDVDDLTRNANDFDVAYNAASFGEFPYPYRKEHAHNLVEYATAQMSLGREFHFGIHMDREGTLVGAVAAAHIDPVNRKCEIGYWLGREHWGRGLAKEAVSLLMQFAFGRLGMNRIYAMVFPFNVRSINLLNALGFRRDGVHREGVLHHDGFVDEEEYSLLAKEYAPLPALISM